MKNEYGGSPPKIFLGAPTASVTRLFESTKQDVKLKLFHDSWRWIVKMFYSAWVLIFRNPGASAITNSGRIKMYANIDV